MPPSMEGTADGAPPEPTEPPDCRPLLQFCPHADDTTPPSNPPIILHHPNLSSIPLPPTSPLPDLMSSPPPPLLHRDHRRRPIPEPSSVGISPVCRRRFPPPHNPAYSRLCPSFGSQCWWFLGVPDFLLPKLFWCRNLYTDGVLSTIFMFLGFCITSVVNGTLVICKNRFKLLWILTLICQQPSFYDRPCAGRRPSGISENLDQNLPTDQRNLGFAPVTARRYGEQTPNDREGFFLLWRCGEPPSRHFGALAIKFLTTTLEIVSVNPTVIFQVWRYATANHGEPLFQEELLYNLHFLSTKSVFHPISNIGTPTSYVLKTNLTKPSAVSRGHRHFRHDSKFSSSVISCCFSHVVSKNYVTGT